MKKLVSLAGRNMRARLSKNPYPGRGIVAGLSECGGAFVQVYWIMGRSTNSRNRVFVAAEGGVVRTAPHDPSLCRDPSLIIYNALRELPGVFIATNGDQTDTIFERVKAGGSFRDAFDTREREPDAPNFTPRIAAMFDLRGGKAFCHLAVLRASRFAPEKTDRFYFTYDPCARGLGYCVTTYRGDGDPLPSFEGEPYLVPLRGDPDAIADRYWETLNQDNRVSLAVKWIPLTGGPSLVTIRNKLV